MRAHPCPASVLATTDTRSWPAVPPCHVTHQHALTHICAVLRMLFYSIFLLFVFAACPRQLSMPKNSLECNVPSTHTHPYTCVFSVYPVALSTTLRSQSISRRTSNAPICAFVSCIPMSAMMHPSCQALQNCQDTFYMKVIPRHVRVLIVLSRISSPAGRSMYAAWRAYPFIRPPPKKIKINKCPQSHPNTTIYSVVTRHRYLSHSVYLNV